MLRGAPGVGREFFTGRKFWSRGALAIERRHVLAMRLFTDACACGNVCECTQKFCEFRELQICGGCEIFCKIREKNS